MIFSDSWVNRIGADLGGTVVCVFQGTQPTMAEYIANANSYRFDSTNLLQVILTGTVGGGGSTPLITDPNTLGYAQALYSVRAGTGTWATLASGTGEGQEVAFDSYENLDGYYSLDPSYAESLANSYTYYNQSFAIVPISDLSGTGVIKFNSTVFSHPDSADEDRALDMSMTVSRAEG